MNAIHGDMLASPIDPASFWFFFHTYHLIYFPFKSSWQAERFIFILPVALCNFRCFKIDVVIQARSYSNQLWFWGEEGNLIPVTWKNVGIVMVGKCHFQLKIITKDWILPETSACTCGTIPHFCIAPLTSFRLFLCMHTPHTYREGSFQGVQIPGVTGASRGGKGESICCLGHFQVGSHVG